MESIVIFLSGFIFGLLIATFYQVYYKQAQAKALERFYEGKMQDQKESFHLFAQEVKSSIKSMSFDALSQSADTMLKATKGQLTLGQESIARELHSNKSHMDLQVGRMGEELHKVSQMLINLEQDRKIHHSELGSLISETNAKTTDLIKNTTVIKDLLSNSQSRGQWGERIAEDILNMAGFIEDINYKKQLTLKSGERPDFTFLLPNDLHLHMDAKFPFASYQRYLDPKLSQTQEKNYKLFIQDVKSSIKSLKNRSYGDSERSIGCILLFIPNEQVFSFLQKEAPEVFEQALKDNIIACSPLTLFAILAIIRKSLEHFIIEKTSKEIINHLHSFYKQWEMYTKCYSGVGKKINDLQDEYDKLTSTRTKQLDNIFQKIKSTSLPVKDSLTLP